MEKEEALVSVIMPAYNAEKYIEEAISSVVSQTYKNWELLILDDCSSDRTGEIAELFEKADPRIHLFRNSQNLGAARTRNRGLDLARGEWIALLDCDDVWHEEKLEKQLVIAGHSGADIIYCSYLFSCNSAQCTCISCQNMIELNRNVQTCPSRIL